jgi:hypothetical protein
MQSLIDRYPWAFWFAGVVAIWLVVCPILSRMGGWGLLARRFRCRGKFTGTTWMGQDGMMGGIAPYRKCLTVGGNSDGLYVATALILRFGHPPLLIPWNEVTYTKAPFFTVPGVQFQLGRDRPVRLSVPESLANQLKEAAGNAWPTESLA